MAKPRLDSPVRRVKVVQPGGVKNLAFAIEMLGLCGLGFGASSSKRQPDLLPLRLARSCACCHGAPARDARNAWEKRVLWPEY